MKEAKQFQWSGEKGNSDLIVCDDDMKPMVRVPFIYTVQFMRLMYGLEVLGTTTPLQVMNFVREKGTFLP